ncbi:MAG: uroporphyrinogen decarboxylase family protein [Desulfitobacteriaceae bacterium]|nr:uroporphyrinogen decarboxylase family protein [Desulfitobacteriaceae bacterium]
MCLDRLTPSERVKALVAKKGLDRVPVNPSASIYTAGIYGMSSKEYYLEPEKALQAQLWAVELHQSDANPSYNIPDWSGWDFGGELKIPTTPRISLPHITKRAVENAKDLETLKIPDINTAPAASRILQFARLCRAKGFPVSVPGGSPFGIAESIVGTELLMRWLYKEPELVHRALRLATDYLLKIADRFVDEFGTENCSAFCTYPMESHAMISPKMFEKFSLIYVKEIHEKFISKGIKKWVIHLCGDHTQNLPFWLHEIKLAPRTIFTIGHEMDIEYTAKSIGEEHIIGGNIPTTLLQQGTPNEVFATSRELIQKMKGHPGGFILMPACAMPPLTPPTNVYAMVKAARVFGRY